MKKVRAFNKLVQGGAAETTKIAMLALGVRGVYDE